MKNLVKIAALAAVTAAGAASMASASINSFGIVPDLDDRASYINLSTVRSTQDGTVEIQNLNGDVLGMASVREGVNKDVRIRFTTAPTQDVVAVLIGHR
jgi:hypothetical protein